jgi:hypothetical protein
MAPDWIAAVNSSIDSELMDVSIPLNRQKKNSPSSVGRGGVLLYRLDSCLWSCEPLLN